MAKEKIFIRCSCGRFFPLGELKLGETIKFKCDRCNKETILLTAIKQTIPNEA
jgi:hypothetical protein